MDIAITTINDNITNIYDRDKKKTIRKMIKSGFLTIDGNICQYNPNGTFTRLTDDYVTGVYGNIITSNGNYWDLINQMQVIELLQNELPSITKIDADNFKNYVEQSQVIINEELIQDLLKDALNENKELKRDIDFTGKKDLVSQITVLRNNDIFTDNQRRLFKYKDGKFLRYTSNDIIGVLNDVIGTDDSYFVIGEVKNNFIHYNQNLTDVTKLVELMRIKELKESTLKNCKPGFDKVMKIISKYGGKRQ